MSMDRCERCLSYSTAVSPFRDHRDGKNYAALCTPCKFQVAGADVKPAPMTDRLRVVWDMLMERSVTSMELYALYKRAAEFEQKTAKTEQETQGLPCVGSRRGSSCNGRMMPAHPTRQPALAALGSVVCGKCGLVALPPPPPEAKP